MKFFFITAIWISSLSLASEKNPPQDLQEIKLVNQEEKDLPINQEMTLIRYLEIPNLIDSCSFIFPFLLNGTLHIIPTFINKYFAHEIRSLRKAVSNGLELEISDSQKSTLEQIDHTIKALFLL